MPKLLRRFSPLALLFVVSCVQPIVARAPVMYPARVPARAFPELLVAGAPLPEGDLAATLIAHLQAEKGRKVTRVEVKELEPMRAAGSMSPLTLVLLVEPTLYTDVREDWDLVPVQICDFYWGCFIDYQSMYMRTPALIGQVRLTVYEGPTARTLQTEIFETISFARNTKPERARVLADLGKQLERAVDVLAAKQRIELLPVDDIAEVSQALAAIKKGDWQGGRKILETVARSLGGQSRGVQARVWYDLGMARWHSDPSGELPQENYEAARRALQLAASLDKRFEGTLAALERARERQMILRDQRSAAAHNRKLYEWLREN